MNNYHFADDINKKKELPAGWRGIGCIMMLLLPIVSYVAADVLLEIPKIRKVFYRMAPKLFGRPNIPKITWLSSEVESFFRIVRSWTNLEINLLFGAIILLALSGLIAVIYALAYRIVNPRRYGPTDAPPSRRKAKKHSR